MRARAHQATLADVADVADPQAFLLSIAHRIRALTDPRREQLAARGRFDHRRNRAAAFDQSDHHRKLAVAIDELARSVNRIDEEDAVRLAKLAERLRIALLGHHRHARKLTAQLLDD